MLNCLGKTNYSRFSTSLESPVFVFCYSQLSSPPLCLQETLPQNGLRLFLEKFSPFCLYSPWFECSWLSYETALFWDSEPTYYRLSSPCQNRTFPSIPWKLPWLNLLHAKHIIRQGSDLFKNHMRKIQAHHGYGAIRTSMFFICFVPFCKSQAISKS